jgi:hypothetical protein
MVPITTFTRIIHLFIYFVDKGMSKSLGAYKIEIFRSTNLNTANLGCGVYYEKSCLSKPHYLTTKIKKKRLDNYYATIHWVLQLLCNYPPRNTVY